MCIGVSTWRSDVSGSGLEGRGGGGGFLVLWSGFGVGRRVCGVSVDVVRCCAVHVRGGGCGVVHCALCGIVGCGKGEHEGYGVWCLGTMNVMDDGGYVHWCGVGRYGKKVLGDAEHVCWKTDVTAWFAELVMSVHCGVQLWSCTSVSRMCGLRSEDASCVCSHVYIGVVKVVHHGNSCRRLHDSAVGGRKIACVQTSKRRRREKSRIARNIRR